MAGEVPLAAQETPDYFQWVFVPIVTGAADNIVLLPDRDVVVDGAWIRAGAIGATDKTVRLTRVSDATAISDTGTPISSALDLDTGGQAANTKYNFTMTTTANLVKAGEAVTARISAGATEVTGIMVGLRVRTQQR